MPKTYAKANEWVQQLLEAELREHFPVLAREAGARGGVVLIQAAKDAHGLPRGPALTVRGVACLAKIQTTTTPQRLVGAPDFIIHLDGDRIGDLSERRLRALLAHELMHLDFAGEWDDAARPKLSLRAHDYEIGVFRRVVQWYGDDSPERQLLTVVAAHDGQLLLFPTLHLDDAALAPQASEV